MPEVGLGAAVVRWRPVREAYRQVDDQVREVPVPHDEWRASLRMNHANAAALLPPWSSYQPTGSSAPALPSSPTWPTRIFDSSLSNSSPHSPSGPGTATANSPTRSNSTSAAARSTSLRSRSISTNSAKRSPSPWSRVAPQPRHRYRPARPTPRRRRGTRRLRPRRPWTLAPLRRVRPQPGYRDMERFTGTLDDPATSAALEAALDGRGAFRTLSCCA